MFSKPKRLQEKRFFGKAKTEKIGMRETCRELLENFGRVEGFEVFMK
jgi:hypothetical protein